MPGSLPVDRKLFKSMANEAETRHHVVVDPSGAGGRVATTADVAAAAAGRATATAAGGAAAASAAGAFEARVRAPCRDPGASRKEVCEEHVSRWWFGQPSACVSILGDALQ